MLEGIAYEHAEWARLTRQAGRDVDLREARAIGGGAASDCGTRSRPTCSASAGCLPLRQECGVLGDALIAAAATDHVTDLPKVATAWQQTTDPVLPDPDRHERYQRLLAPTASWASVSARCSSGSEAADQPWPARRARQLDPDVVLVTARSFGTGRLDLAAELAAAGLQVVRGGQGTTAWTGWPNRSAPPSPGSAGPAR